MYDLDVIKHASIQRIKGKPADIFLTSTVEIFNQTWLVFAEAVAKSPDEYARRFGIMEESVAAGLAKLDTVEGSIHHATRYASMAYLTCGLAQAKQSLNPTQIPQAAVTRTISGVVNKLAVMNAYVHGFMGELHAKRSFLVNPLQPKLREALSDYYTVVASALLEIRPFASQAADVQKLINSTIEDSIIIAQNNGFDLHIPSAIRKRGEVEVAMNSMGTPVQFPSLTRRSLIPQPEIIRAAYKTPPASATPPAAEPTRPAATVTKLDDAMRETIRQRRLAEAAKRATPKDPA